ncbi:Ig-like domain-containing protein [Candidatus Gracilibacteria bacterium]|nr:Ig-like domain-containing protein [Candidatus Gracilibacteria bacterium]
MNRFAKILAGFVGIVMFGSFVAFASSATNSTVSATKSIVLPESQTVKINKETAKITVFLADENGNPVSGHDVRLISSSNNDSVVPFFGTNISGQNGEVVFEASGKENGLVTYIAYDLTSNTVLDAKSKVVYFDNGNYLFEDIGNSSGPVSKLKFDNVPSSVTVGDSVTFNLTAIDAQNQTVTTYTGTIKFSINGSNAFYASLPNDYTFSANDVGAHAFSLASAFKQAGTYNVEARDINTPSVYGEYTFIVLPKSGTSGSTQVVGTTSSITLSNPVAGTYSNPIQVISGNAKSGAKLKIFDNNFEIGSANADTFGAFTYTTNKLADGEHVIYVASVDDIGTVLDQSATVTFNIDTEAPEVSKITVTPSTSVLPNTKITINLTSKETLSKATLSFNGNLYDMTDSGKGYYEISLTVPADNGDYPLLFIVLDQLGNESVIDQKTSVKVSLAGTGDFENLPQAETGLIGDVLNVNATTYDRKVTLNWEKPVIGADLIKNYRVYYGLSPSQLTEAIDTFTNSTTWYVSNLKNGTQYYFSVIGVDAKGNTSAHFSNIVSAVPNSAVSNVVSPDVKLGLAGGEAIAEMQKDASQAGPEIIWMVVMSSIGGAFYVKSSKLFK